MKTGDDSTVYFETMISQYAILKLGLHFTIYFVFISVTCKLMKYTIKVFNLLPKYICQDVTANAFAKY